MACCGEALPPEKTQGMSSGMRPCDVCVLLDADRTPKKTLYCKRCDAHMCESCFYNTRRRAAAMVARRIQNFLGRFKQRTEAGA
jgi:hypothetical protein